MDRQSAEEITTKYLKPVFGFAVKRCKSLQDAEDLSQEIAVKLFRTLLVRDDIEDINKFIWTIAHNALSNYYRDHKPLFIGTPTFHGDELDADLILREETYRLQNEIAYLSKLQRKIVIAYYYENKKQQEIADDLGLPLGTVKWHLFEAKKDLKRGMDKVRSTSELKFNPIKFSLCGISGSVGKSGFNFFKSALSQNIVYSVLENAKTTNEIANDLGVSPVYVESEAEQLEEYGFLLKKGGKYLCNILLEKPFAKLNALHDEIYEKAAKLFANELYDDLINSDIWETSGIYGGCMDISLTEDNEKDKNFFLWALIPYIAALSGEALMDRSVSFEEAATLRPDGGHNICYDTVLSPETPPKYHDSMRHWCGPCTFNDGELSMWLIDSEWSEKRIDDTYHLKIGQDFSLLRHLNDGDELSGGEYAYLEERGITKTVASGGYVKTGFQCVFINGSETKKVLLSFGDKIREKYKDEFDSLRKKYFDALFNKRQSSFMQ